MAQSPDEHAGNADIVRYDRGWNAINHLLREGRSLSGHERNCAFLNTGLEKFADVSAATGLDFIDDSRVLALSDWDYDGDTDIWAANRSGPQVRFLRNDLGSDQNFIAIGLLGSTCNRDGIGARVTIESSIDGRKHLQTETLRAGEGYLAQSSKWLRFGVGTAKRVSRIAVKWPDGSEQRFETLASNKWYRIRQGDPSASEWTPPAQGFQRLTASTLTAPPISDRAQVPLLKVLPLPQIEYLDAAGSVRRIDDDIAKARLVNLWATWCAPCLTELQDWSKHADAFKAAGLEILAINIDGASASHESTKEPQQVYQALNLSFPSGIGSPSLVAHFDAIQRALLSRQRPLPIPCSFLIDEQGRLRAIYKGPVSADKLLREMKRLDGSDHDSLLAATPFPGQWLVPPKGSSPLQITRKLLESGDLDAAQRYMRALFQGAERNPEYVSASLYSLHAAVCLDKGQLEDALTSFRAALALVPNNRLVHIELGKLLNRVGKGKEAIPHFQQALSTNPNDPELIYRLGVAHLQGDQFAHAKRELLRAIEISNHPAAYWKLAEAQQGLGETKNAIGSFEKALLLNPSFATKANDLAWLLATASDASLRNGPRAVHLAEGMVQQTKSSAKNLDILSAAYAEVGRFEEAVEVATQAIRLAKQSREVEFEKLLEERRARYRERKPFRQ